MLKVRLRLCAWITINGAPSTFASTNPSELDAQRLAERPTTAVWHGAPPPAGLILARMSSCSKYFSCSATQTAENAMFDTAVKMLTSGSSFCCASIWAGHKAKANSMETVNTPREVRLRMLCLVMLSPFLLPHRQKLEYQGWVAKAYRRIYSSRAHLPYWKGPLTDL